MPNAPAPAILARAILLLLGAQLLFNLVDTTGKYLVRDFPVVTVTWVRYVLQLVFMLAYARLYGIPMSLRTNRLGMHIARGLVLLGFAGFLFAALKFLPQAEAVAISFVAPLAILVLAGPLLGEHVGWPRWAAALGGFAGMLIVVRPGAGLAPIGVGFALATLACNAAFQLLTRKLAMTENAMTMVLLSALISSAGATLLLPLGLPDHWPDAWQTLLFLSFGVTGTISHFLLIRAYRLAPASLLAPFFYCHIIIATFCGWLFFGQLPDAVTFTGIGAIVASGAAIALYERGRSARQAASRS